MAQQYKLKDTTALDLKDGEKREVEVDGIEGGKVLLVKVNGKVHATSPNCTHYGAPLKNGVLTPDGRLTCAWHGACFSVATGDVEDAPALDPLAKFEITEKNGAVYITGDEATIKSSRRMPNTKCAAQAQASNNVIVVGGGSGAVGAVQSLREQGFKGPITMIHDEPYLPVDRTKLSKALIADPAKIELRSQSWYKNAAIETVHDTVTGVDFKVKSVATKSGTPRTYGKLIIATGGIAKKLPMPGFKDLANIFVLRAVTDVQAITKAVDKKDKKIVVVGSSFIGMEVGNALSKENHVSIVGTESTPLERIMGAEVGKIFQKSLSKSGVKFYMNAKVDSAIASKADGKKVGSVKLDDGTVLEADLVILGVGVSPATDFLKDNSSIKLEDDGSLLTDESFAVKGLSDVFAIGDIAKYPYHGPGSEGTLTRIEHWNVAQNAGRTAAQAIVTDGNVASKPFIPIFWSALGSQLRYCGNTPNGWDDLVLQGQPEEGKFAAFYGKGNTTVAVASMMMDPVMTQSAELMRRSKMPSMKELRGGLNVLDVALPREVQV